MPKLASGTAAPLLFHHNCDESPILVTHAMHEPLPCLDIQPQPGSHTPSPQLSGMHPTKSRFLQIIVLPPDPPAELFISDSSKSRRLKRSSLSKMRAMKASPRTWNKRSQYGLTMNRFAVLRGFAASTSQQSPCTTHACREDPFWTRLSVTQASFLPCPSLLTPLCLSLLPFIHCHCPHNSL